MQTYETRPYDPLAADPLAAEANTQRAAERQLLLEQVIADSSASQWHDDALGALAVSQCNQGDYESAISSANWLLNSYSWSQWSADARAVLVSSHYELGQYEEALKAWAQLRQQHPDSRWAGYDGLPDLWRSYCRPDVQEPGGIFFSPSIDYAGVASQLTEEFSDPIMSSPSDARILFSQAMALYKVQRYADAFAPLQLLIDTYPQDKWGIAANYFWADIFVQLNGYPVTEGCRAKFVVGYHDDQLLSELIEQAICYGYAANPVSEANTLQNIGSIYYAQRNYEEARFYYKEAFKIWRQLGNTIRAGNAIHDLAVIYESQNNYTLALQNYEYALQTLRQTPNSWHTEAQVSSAYTLNKIGALYEVMGEYDQARQIYQQTMGAWKDVEDQIKEAEVWRHIGATYHAQNNYNEALNAYQQALAIAQEQDNNANSEAKGSQAATLDHIGLLYHSQGRYTETLQTYREALALWDQVGSGAESERANTLNHIGLAYHAQNNYLEALIYYQQALELWQEQQDPFGQAVALNNIGMIYQAQQNYTLAEINYQQALSQWYYSGQRGATFVHSLQMPFFSGLVYKNYGRQAFATQQINQPMALRVLALANAGEATTRSNLAATYASQMDFPNTKENYERAWHLQEQSGDQAGAQTTMQNYETLILQQHFDNPEVRSQTKSLLEQIACLQQNSSDCDDSQ